MLNLSTPEVIQAHKDYAQRNCSVCGVDISSKRSDAKFCSKTCTKKAWSVTPKGKALQKRSNKKYGQTEAGKASRHTYYLSDKGQASHKKHNKSDTRFNTQWSINQKNSKLALKVNSMFTKATERQRHRLADWLLRVHHKSCVYYTVDDWIADYNTSLT